MSDIGVYLLVGWAVLAIVGIIFSRFKWPAELSGVVNGLVVIWGFLRYRGEIFRLTLGKSYSIGVFLVVFTVICFHLVATVMMGAGNYPKVFFGVETPYYLYHAHALTQFDQYPPPNLGYFDLDFDFSYHYGIPAMAAILARLSGLAVHHSMFLFMVPVLLVATICAAVKLVQATFTTNQSVLWIGLLIIFFPLIIESELVTSVFTDPRWALSRFANPQTFGGGFQMLSTQFGVAIGLVVFYCMLRIDELGKSLLFVCVVGLLVFFKSPHFLGLGLGIAGWSIVRLFHNRQLKPLVLSVIALALSLCLQAILTTPSVALKIELGYHLETVRLPKLIGILPIFVLPLLVIYWDRTINRGWTIFEWSWFIVGPMLLVNILILERVHIPGGEGQHSHDMFQTLHLSPYAFSVIVLLILGQSWEKLSNGKTIVCMMVVIACALPTFVHQWYNVQRILFRPDMSHEFVDNREIARALRSIEPVKGSLSVTNDYTYRMAFEDRNDRQFQIPAIFGHAWYGTVFAALENKHPQARIRYDSQLIYRQEQWTRQMLDEAIRHGWTHLLLNKIQQYPRDIPGKPLFESDKYIVYQFEEIAREIKKDQ